MSKENKKEKRSAGSKISTFLIVLVLIAGLGIMSYPKVADWWNSMHQAQAISTYDREIATTDKAALQKIWDDAIAYNERQAVNPDPYNMTDEQKAEYESLLNGTDTGIMGYIEIPGQKIKLPIYHGTTEGVLQIAVGHLEGSSLPVGGESSHCVLTGHTGLPSAKLFTDIDRMKIGDTFKLVVLDNTLTYEVDQIDVVEPYELDRLRVEEGKDLCTLVTCTPYGINTHRLLVRGHRVENAPDTVAAPSQNWEREALIVTFLLWLPFMILAAGILILIFFVIRHHRRLKRIRQSIKEERNYREEHTDEH